MRLLRLALLLLLPACGTEVRAAAAEEQIAAELKRLEGVQKGLETAELPQMFREIIEPNRQALAAAAAETPSAGLRLYRLRSAKVAIETLQFVAAHLAAGESLTALETLWKARQPSMVSVAAPADAPLLKRALVEAASNRAGRLFRASLPYGKVSSPMSGLYYLAEAEANVAFARFAASLPMSGESEPAPKAAALERELAAVERETIRVFEKDPVGRGAIGPSARMKECRELLDASLLAGAALTLAEARLAVARSAGLEAYPGPVARPQREPSSIGAMFAAMNDPLVTSEVLPLLERLR